MTLEAKIRELTAHFGGPKKGDDGRKNQTRLNYLGRWFGCAVSPEEQIKIVPSFSHAGSSSMKPEVVFRIYLKEDLKASVTDLEFESSAPLNINET
ncbi:hypothetical protein TNCV_1951781 [Trichonephila clavipes]|nr:hypothetical protein TNCV_1951781 [Trichonephila clavipes]